MTVGEERKMPHWYLATLPLVLSLSSAFARSQGLTLDMISHVTAALCTLYGAGILVLYHRGKAWTWLALAGCAAVSIGLCVAIRHPRPSFLLNSLVDLLTFALASTVVASVFLLLNLPASDAGQRAHRRKIARVPAIALALLVAVLGLGPLTLTV